MSLIEEIDPVFMANSLIIDAHKGFHILVEGETDDIFFSKFLNLDICQIEVCNGKENVLEVLKIVNEHRKKKDVTVAIVDKDFDFLFPINYPDNLLQTDCHDIEMMCVQSNSFDFFLTEYLSKTKIKNFCQKQKIKSIKDYFLEIIKPLSEIRILSIVENLNLAFKPSKERVRELDYKKFICKDELIFRGYENLVESVKTYYNQAVHLVTSEIVKKLNLLNLAAYSLFDICKGHDFSQLLVIAIQRRLGRQGIKTVTPDEIERALRLSFSQQDFDKTELRLKLQQISDDILRVV